MTKHLLLFCLISLMILAGTVACRPKEVELPFETIERSPGGPYLCVVIAHLIPRLRAVSQYRTAPDRVVHRARCHPAPTPRQ